MRPWLLRLTETLPGAACSGLSGAVNLMAGSDSLLLDVVGTRCGSSFSGSYDVSGGTYDLTIRREGRGAPIVELKGQPNATNARASSVDKFSFVGSVFEDDSNVTFYVDDVVVGTDEKVLQGPFVAPGRRKLFVDRWREAQAMLRRNPDCPPMLSSADSRQARPPAAGASQTSSPAANVSRSPWMCG